MRELTSNEVQAVSGGALAFILAMVAVDLALQGATIAYFRDVSRILWKKEKGVTSC